MSGIGPKTFMVLLNYFKTARAAFSVDVHKLKKAGLGDKLILSFDKFRNQLNVDSYKEKLKQKNVQFVAFRDKEYLKLLKQISNLPIVLYVKGEFKNVNFEKTISVVGTRKITHYGREITELFARDLALGGIWFGNGS